MTPDNICPFSAPLQKPEYDCEHAQTVIRRGGEEIACQNNEHYAVCTAVHDTIKQTALNAMGLEDDLLSVPHSTLVKIQFGAITGLQQELDLPESDNIATLISSAIAQHGEAQKIPMDKTIDAIQNFKLQRRRR